jgi:hypothetical protein
MRARGRYGLSHEACFYGGRVELAEEEVEKSKELFKLVESLSK